VQQGESLNVLAELVDVKLGTQLWAEQYTRKIADLVTVQNDIAADISGALRLELSGEEQARLVETVSSDAYEAYLKGRYFVNKRTGEGFSTALTFFEQALAADANYALAHVGVADSYLLLGAFYGNPEEYPPSATMTKAMTSVRDALELDPNLAEAHTTLAYIEFLHNWDWEASETEFRRAIELKPDYAPAHQWYSELLMVLGRHDEAVGEARQALSLDPASAILSRELAFRLHLARRYDESIEQFRKTLELDPDFFDVRKMLIEVYWDAGMKDEALAESPNIGDRRESNSYRSLWRRIFELVAAGKTAEAVARIGSSPQDEY